METSKRVFAVAMDALSMLLVLSGLAFWALVGVELVSRLVA